MTETTEDFLLGGRVRLEQPAVGLRAAIDAVLLAAAIPARAPEAVLELGCGTGAALLCLAARVPGLALHGVELDGGLAEMARRNAGGLGASIVAGDIRGALPACRHAFANPPYWPGGSASPIALRRNAAHEAEAGLEDWAGALARGLVLRGTASMILPAARFGQAAAALRGAGCGSLTMLPLWPRAGVAAKRVILQAIKGGRGPDRLLPGLVLHEADGSFTAAAEAVLRHAQALPQG
ncbi:methyltransferase domain-containing protein [Rhodovarius sp.]|uniref:tRNA1(Val) (adenine(37)-N6)-methyltransferase n=1 Tax=Rhodovarius sp. TaxID=2972673 RepID=UPI003340D3C5